MGVVAGTKCRPVPRPVAKTEKDGNEPESK